MNTKKDEELKLKSEFDALNNKVLTEINEFIQLNQNTLLNEKALKPELEKYKNNLYELLKKIQSKDEEQSSLNLLVI